MAYKFDTITTHLQTTGYIFQGSQIYGGLSNTWDYGPLGAQIKMNLKNYFIKKFIQEQPTNVLLDPSILMNPKVWEATGHLANFSDPLIDCKSCKSRYRADKIIAEQFPDLDVEGMTPEELNDFVASGKLVCPSCGEKTFTPVRKFNMMFKTHIGVTDDSLSEVYLRPETAQGLFVNFNNVMRTTRRKLPIGLVDIGKAFRNEITPGNFTFRTREFEQMEMEFFCSPESSDEWFVYWKKACLDFIESLGMKAEHLRYRDHEPAELAFYSKATTDVEYLFPFGWGELMGVASRTDYDLKKHASYSGENFEYIDPTTDSRYVPYCIEPSFGCDRLLLALFCDAYSEEELAPGDTRIVMHLVPTLAPYKAAILPLSKKLKENAYPLYLDLLKHFAVTYDESASIGKRYRRQDEIGTPLCITVDFDSLEDHKVTVRDRDTMIQERVAIEDLPTYINNKLGL